LLKESYQAIKAVPGLKYGLGVVGVVSLIIAVLVAVTVDFRIAILETILMIVLMTIPVVSARIAKGSSSTTALPGIIIVWFTLFIVSAVNLFLFALIYSASNAAFSGNVQSAPHVTESAPDYTKHWAAPTPLSTNPFEEGLPQPSARFSLRLCESAGKTLGALSDNLLAALNRAGYTDHAIYPFQDGFAVLTRFEQRDLAGNPSSDRWPELGQPAIPLSKLFSVDYIRALFLGKRGIFRFFIFTLTSESPKIGPEETSPAEARTWLLTGPTQLPNDVRRSQTQYPFLFTSIVYEFDAAEDHAKFVEESALTGLTELLGSKIVKQSNQDVVPSSICFDTQFATLQ
jgi:hypothetical protein